MEIWTRGRKYYLEFCSCFYWTLCITVWNFLFCFHSCTEVIFGSCSVRNLWLAMRFEFVSNGKWFVVPFRQFQDEQEIIDIFLTCAELEAGFLSVLNCYYSLQNEKCNKHYFDVQWHPVGHIFLLKLLEGRQKMFLECGEWMHLFSALKSN